LDVRWAFAQCKDAQGDSEERGKREDKRIGDGRKVRQPKIKAPLGKCISGNTHKMQIRRPSGESGASLPLARAYAYRVAAARAYL